MSTYRADCRSCERRHTFSKDTVEGVSVGHAPFALVGSPLPSTHCQGELHQEEQYSLRCHSTPLHLSDDALYLQTYCACPLIGSSRRLHPRDNSDTTTNLCVYECMPCDRCTGCLPLLPTTASDDLLTQPAKLS